MTLPARLVWLILLPTLAFSLSVCDELDIAFITTTDSIVDSLGNMKTIMQRVMKDGSSESTSYNLMLYGRNVPVAFQNKMIPIYNPTVLEDLRSTLQQNTDSATTHAEISVSDSIRQYKKQGTPQYKPYLKQQRFKEFSDHNYTATQYIVFADDGISSIECDTEDDEINIILKHNISTVGAIGRKCKVNVFSEYDLVHEVKKEMMRLHSITCSAKVLDDDRNEILLNSNAQFVDAHSYIKCNIVFDDTYSQRLNSHKSYIYAVEKKHTAYKLNDYLIVTRDALQDLPDSCKGALVYRITNISVVSVHDLDLQDVHRRLNQTTEVLRLSIESPRTLHEYIFKSNLKKDQKIEVEDQTENRRLFIHMGPHNEKVYDKQWENSHTYNPIDGVDISYSVSFGVDINVYFEFNWDMFTENEEFEFRIYGEYSAGFHFDVEVDNSYSIPLPDLIDVVGNSIDLWFGPIPVWVKPYLKASTQLDVLVPVAVSSVLNCTYRASYNEGYKYDKVNEYIPAYGLIANDYYLNIVPSYDFGTGYDLKSCAQSNYFYESAICEYWAFRDADGSCHCMSYFWYDAATPAQGWDLYKMGAECFSPTTTCESDVTGCGDFGYSLNTYEDQACSDSCYFPCSMYTCTVCNPWSTSDEIIKHFNDEKIHETTILSNVCYKTYSVNENNDLCDTLKYNDKIGFDLVIEPVIGVVLYEIVNVYSRIPILNEFRIQPIETNPSACGLSTTTSMCQSDTHTIYVSFKITISWSLYFGAVINAKDAIESAINALIDDPDTGYVQSITSDIIDPSHEISIFKDINIFSGSVCSKMIDLSSTLNGYLLNSCCGVPDSTTSTPTTTTGSSATTATTTSDGCDVTDIGYVGDGWCDVFGGYNTEACDYDGGDCCEETCIDSSNICGGNGYHCIDPTIILSTENPSTTEEVLLSSSTTENVLIGVSEKVDGDEEQSDHNDDVANSSIQYYVNFGFRLLFFSMFPFFVFY